MFKIKCELSGVSDVKFSSDKIFIFGNKKIKVIQSDNYDEIIELNTSEKIIDFNVYENFIQLKDSYSGNEFYNLNGLFLKKFDKTNFFFVQNLENYIAFLKETKNTIYSKGKFIYEGKISNFLKINDIINFSNTYGEMLYSYYLSTGDKKWEINISQIGKYYDAINKVEKDGSISKILGVYENELIVLLKGGIFIGLDLETGVLNWKLDKVEENNTKQTIDFNFGDPTPNNVFLKNSKVYVFQSSVLIELDLKSQKGKYLWSSDDIHGLGGLSFTTKVLNDNQFYFAATRKENASNADTIGIFDIEKNEIIWLHTFDFPKGVFIRDLKVSENRIYVFVLDSIHTLQVMEKI